MNVKRLIEYILEHAYPRKKFRDRVDGMDQQIVENLALIIWVRNFSFDNWNLNHWKEELLDKCDPLVRMKLKDESDVRKVYDEIFYKRDECHTPDGIGVLCGHKLGQEGIRGYYIKQKIYELTVPILKDLINIMCECNSNKLKDFIYNL